MENKIPMILLKKNLVCLVRQWKPQIKNNIWEKRKITHHTGVYRQPEKKKKNEIGRWLL